MWVLSLGLLMVSALDPRVEFIAKQALRVAVSTPATQYPQSTHQNWTSESLNTWITARAGDWTCGFFPGVLWQLFDVTQNTTWKSFALNFTEGIRGQQTNTGTHDVGFMVFDSFGLGYLLGNQANYKEVVLRTAQSLATRFNPKVGCTMSWNPGHSCREDPTVQTNFSVIIDNMMNLELLLWAGQNGGSSEWVDIAISHADKTASNHVRPDGSTFHVVNYDPTTGEVRNRCTAQGFHDDTTWSRGQAWCIHGFSMVFTYTKLIRFRDTAARCADYFLSQTQEVPMWDFNYPHQTDFYYRDSSAGAIASAGLFGLAETYPVSDPLYVKYSKSAKVLLDSLSNDFVGNYAATEGVLIHATGSFMAKSEVNVSLSYGDFYYLQALRRSSLQGRS